MKFYSALLVLWNSVLDWLSSMEYKNYNSSSERIIFGDLDDISMLNFVILITKKVIFNSNKNRKKGHMYNRFRVR